MVEQASACSTICSWTPAGTARWSGTSSSSCAAPAWRSPTCQVVYRRDGKTLARVDFDFGPKPVVVEVSGRRGHASDAERAKDARRRNELQALGLVVLEFTADDVRLRPAYVVETLRRHLT